MLPGQEKLIADVCRNLCISEATYDKRRKSYGGMSMSQGKRLKKLEAENARFESTCPVSKTVSYLKGLLQAKPGQFLILKNKRLWLLKEVSRLDNNTFKRVKKSMLGWWNTNWSIQVSPVAPIRRNHFKCGLGTCRGRKKRKHIQ